MTISKKQCDLYQIRNQRSKNDLEGWGDITVQWGEGSVHIIANSDYGNFSKFWCSTGSKPKEFLIGIDFDYCMKNLMDYKHMEDNPDGYDREVKIQICEGRRNYPETLSKKDARQAWSEMLGIYDEYNSKDLYMMKLVDHDLFNKVFGDYEYLPSSKRYKFEAVDFWRNVWLPFIEILKTEVAAA